VTTTHAEFQEELALALIYNQWVSEAAEGEGGEGGANDVADLVPHPTGNYNTCKVCKTKASAYVCQKCSKPKAAKERQNVQTPSHLMGEQRFRGQGMCTSARRGCAMPSTSVVLPSTTKGPKGQMRPAPKNIYVLHTPTTKPATFLLVLLLARAREVSPRTLYAPSILHKSLEG
jgi:hypothetical protein